MHCCAAAIDGLDDLESGIAGDLTHGTDGTARLFEQDVPRPGRGAGADEDAFLAFHQRLWKAVGIAHHTIDLTVEHQLHLSRDVAPVAGRSHNDGIGLLHHLQYPLRIILSEYAFLFRAAGHTARAGLYGQVVGIDHLHRITMFFRLLLHDAEHLRNQSLLSRTSVYYQYVHITVVLISTL